MSPDREQQLTETEAWIDRSKQLLADLRECEVTFPTKKKRRAKARRIEFVARLVFTG
jgi:transcriptional regulator of heat shock response